MSATVRFVIDGAAMARLTKGPDGLVWQHLERRFKMAFQPAARMQAPFKTGCLHDSILARPIVGDPLGLSLRVVSDTTPCSPSRTAYSLFVHEGTLPHVIKAKNGGVLRFFWEAGPKGPGVYFFRSIQHPGTQPNHFLTDNLHVFVD